MSPKRYVYIPFFSTCMIQIIKRLFSFPELYQSYQYFIYLLQGTEVDDSLPVDIVTEELKRGDALTGDTYVYTSVADVLLERGLAIPNRQ